MTPKTSIDALAYALGPMHDAVTDWAEPSGKSREFIERMVASGIRSFSYLAYGALFDTIDEAVDRVFERSSVARSQIDLVVYTCSLPTSCAMPPTDLIRRIGRRHGLSCEGFCLSQQQCVSTLLALHLLPCILARNVGHANVLIVSADVTADERLRCLDGVQFDSDGAAAMIVRRGAGELEVLATHIATDGRYFDYDDRPADDVQWLNAYSLSFVKMMAPALKRVLAAAGASPADVRYLIPYSANARLWRIVCSAAGLPGTKLYMPNVGALGHVYACDPIINLETALDSGAVRPGDLVVVGAIGAGRTCGFSLIACR